MAGRDRGSPAVAAPFVKGLFTTWAWLPIGTLPGIELRQLCFNAGQQIGIA